MVAAIKRGLATRDRCIASKMEGGAVTKEQQYAALLQQRAGITKRRTPSSFEEVSTCVSVCYREVKLASARRT